MPNSPQYDAALETVRAATRVFKQRQWEYRNRVIGDAEYLAASEVYKAAERAYDNALAAELQSDDEASAGIDAIADATHAGYHG